MADIIDLVLIGAGQRGAEVYGKWIASHPGRARLIAVAEPDPARRERVSREHGLPADRCFDDWRPLIAAGLPAHGAIIATQDALHAQPAIAALEAGQHVLLEKPMASRLDDCLRLVDASAKTGRHLQICHVLRYAPFWRVLKSVVDSGRLGQIVTVEHRENVAWWHMAHSFVRGNWRSMAGQGSPMILAKCCHDLDLLTWILPSPCASLSSVGSLLHFKPDQAPDGAPDRCTQDCPVEADCPYSAIGIYLEARPFPQLRARAESDEIDFDRLSFWPFSVLGADFTKAGRSLALETGPYGRCVYRCDNDVVDHQVVSMVLEDGTSVVLTMHGHAHEEHRSVRYEGTRASLIARTGRESSIEVFEHGGSSERIPIPEARSGHGGGDAAIMHDYLSVLAGEIEPLTDAKRSIESHLLAFAAEEARLDATVVDMKAFRSRAGL